MSLRLDHVFILTQSDARAGDRLVQLGMPESAGRSHKGQGTTNRRFEFSNGMLELLWVHNVKEAVNGPAAGLNFLERCNDLNTEAGACPFGIILGPSDSSVRSDSSAGVDSTIEPFSGWEYQPDYFPPPTAFHVGMNSEILSEPLCVYAPFFRAPVIENKSAELQSFQRVTQTELMVACDALSETLVAANKAAGLRLKAADEHLMQITFDDGRLGMRCDLRPGLPLIILW